MAVPGATFLNGNAHSRSNRACANATPVLEQKENKSKSGLFQRQSVARGGAEVSKRVHDISFRHRPGLARAGTGRRMPSGLGRQFVARHERDIAVEERLGDAEKARHDRRLIVKVHRRLAGETLVSREDTRIREILRDKESSSARLIRASMLRDFEQSVTHGAVMTGLGAYDRSNGQHGVLFLTQPGALESSGVQLEKAAGRGFAETRDGRVNVVAGSPLPKRLVREVWISVSFLAALGSGAADAVADRVYKRVNT
jgi:hypothetical protein